MLLHCFYIGISLQKPSVAIILQGNYTANTLHKTFCKPFIRCTFLSQPIPVANLVTCPVVATLEKDRQGLSCENCPTPASFRFMIGPGCICKAHLTELTIVGLGSKLHLPLDLFVEDFSFSACLRGNFVVSLISYKLRGYLCLSLRLVPTDLLLQPKRRIKAFMEVKKMTWKICD